ncbi:LytTR family DNA-binding domain-containing protein [Oscillospiraceae bacterium 38-13]
MMTFAICDDEPRMVRELTRLLADYMGEKRISAYSADSFAGGRALLDSGGGFDVIFLDIRMDGPDGMETAGLLRRRGDQSLLIFVTALKECVFDAFRVEAFDYLLKPLTPDAFSRTMDRVLRALEKRTTKNLVIQRGTACEVVPLSAIVYCEVLGRKIYLHKSDGTVSGSYDSLEDLERRVDRRFFKCHRSYLVNLDYVRGCQSGQAALSSGESVPVSRLRERELTQALLRHMKDRSI